MRFRSGEAAVMSHILLHSLRPSDKPLCTDRYVNDQAICMLTSSQRGCVCTPQDLSAGCISSTIQTHELATKGYTSGAVEMHLGKRTRVRAT